jgi:serpin B
MKNLIAISLLMGLVLMGCQKPENNSPSIKDNADPILKAAIVEQNNSFSVDIFKQIIKNEEEQKNVFISPMSMYYALGMACIGAVGETNHEFKSLLGWQNQTDSSILIAMKSLYSDISPVNEGITFEVANSLWQRLGFPIKDSYKSQVAEYFDAEVSELDFDNPQSVDVINNWIEEKTHDRIQDMLDAISPDAIMYLINAIYFKADWKCQFDEAENRTMTFTKSDNQTTDVTFMRQKGTFRYQKNEYCTSIALPYIDSSYSMLMLLPNSQVGMNGFMEQLTLENWKQWKSQMSYQEVEVSIPKFKYDYGTKIINKELQDLGLVKAFNADEADFSNITDFQIFISRVMHKAFIEINEKGSEAAAATIIEFETTSEGPGALSFTADRPFVFAIVHEKSNSVLFIGKVAYPQQ